MGAIAPGPGLTWLPRILKDPLGSMVEVAREFGPVVRVPIGRRVNHLLTRPENIKHVLADGAAGYDKGRTFEKTRGYLGNGLSTSSGDFWRRQRRIMQPHFHKEQVRKLSALMTSTIEETAAKWRARGPGEVFDVWPEMMSLALRVTTRALFGTVVDDMDTVVKSFQVALDHTTRRVLSPIDVPDWLPTVRNVRYRRALRSLDGLVYDLIGRQRKRIEDHTLLGMLMAARDEETGEAMSDEQLRDEIATLMLGGHETTGNALAWSWYLLSRNTAAEQRMREEIAALGDGPPGLEHADRLSWTSAVFLESMRIYPQNWVMSRDTIGEDVIEGFTIPPRTTVFLGVYVCHRDPEHWTDPERFDPSRFLPDAGKGRHPFAYIPFGAGQRKCIGSTFATMEAALVLATLAREFRVEVPPEVIVRAQPSFALRPKGGVPVRVRRA